MPKRTTHKHLKAGDVFLVPMSDTQRALGQILEPGIEFYMCVFDKLLFSQDEVNLEHVHALPILFIGLTTDALFFHGEWKVVGNARRPAAYPRPNSVVNTSGGLVLRDFDRNVIRAAQDADAAFFGYRTSHAPIRFVAAARTAFGLSTAGVDYSNISADDAKRRASVGGQ
jgi:Immunity protein 26